MPQTFLVSLLWTLNVFVNKRNNFFNLLIILNCQAQFVKACSYYAGETDRQTWRHCTQMIIWRLYFPSITAGSISWQPWAVSSCGVCFCYGEAPSPRLCLQEKPSLDDIERKDLSILFQSMKFRWADWWQNPHKWAEDSSVLINPLPNSQLSPERWALMLSERLVCILCISNGQHRLLTSFSSHEPKVKQRHAFETVTLASVSIAGFHHLSAH